MPMIIRGRVAQSTGPTYTQAPSGEDPTARMAARLSDSLLQIGGALVKRHEQEQAIEAQTRLAEFSAKKAQELDAALADPAGLTPEWHKEFEQKYDAEQRALFEGLNISGDTRAKLNKQGVYYRGRHLLLSARAERNRVDLSTEVAFKQSTEIASNGAMTNPESTDILLKQLEAQAEDLTETQRLKLLEPAKQSIQAAGIMGLGQRDPQGTLNDLNKGVYDEVLDPAAKRTLLSNLSTEVRRREAQARTELRLRTVELNAAVNAYGGNIARGVAITPADQQGLLALAEGVPGGKAQVEALINQTTLLSEYAQLPSAQRREAYTAALSRVRDGSGTPAEVALVKGLEGVESRIQAEVNQIGPLNAVAAQEGMVLPADPDVTSSEYVKAMDALYPKVEAYLGRGQEVFNSDQAQRFAADFANASSTGRVSMIANLAGASRATQRSVIRATQKDAPILGAALKFGMRDAPGDGRLMEDVVRGYALYSKNKGLFGASAKDLREQLGPLVGSFGLAPDGEAVAQRVEAAVSLYAYRTGGQPPPTTDIGALKKAYTDLWGKPAAINGHPGVLPPRPDMSAGDIKDMILSAGGWGNLTHTGIDTVYAGDTPISVERAVREMRLVDNGDGTYGIFNDTGKLTYAPSDADSPVILDLTKVARTYRRDYGRAGLEAIVATSIGGAL